MSSRIRQRHGTNVLARMDATVIVQQQELSLDLVPRPQMKRPMLVLHRGRRLQPHAQLYLPHGLVPARNADRSATVVGKAVAC